MAILETIWLYEQMSSASWKNYLQAIHLKIMYKQDLALNNHEGLICYFCLFWRKTHTKRPACEISHETGSGREKAEDSRQEWSVKRRIQSAEGEQRRESTDESVRDETSQQKSALLVALWVFARVHARVSSQNAQKVTDFPLLRLELTQVRVCSFLPPSQLCFTYL